MLWPFGSKDDSAAATFEKTLSQLSTKINKAQSKDASLRSSARRYKALWTLYTSFIYTICTLILVLVTGYQRWAVPEYAAVIGGPLVIWTVRTAIGAIYDFRIGSNGKQLQGLKKQKSEAVRKFKEATRYDSTQQLLEKYGAEPAREKDSRGGTAEDRSKIMQGKPADALKQPTPQRTNLPPPPTANIRRPAQHAPLPPTESPPNQEHPPSLPGSPGLPSGPFPSLSRRDSTASQFAPNADNFTQAQYANQGGRQWYDRLMDVLLGDDEMKPIHRVALICQHCKLVNGQAPPGVKEVGRWRCMSCRGWNGEEREIDKIIEEVDENKQSSEVKAKEEGRTNKKPRAAEHDSTAVDEDELPAKPMENHTENDSS